MVFDGLFVIRLKADGFSSQIIKICLLAPITFFLSVNLLEKGYSRGSSAERSVCVLICFRQNQPSYSAQQCKLLKAACLTLPGTG